MRQNQKRLGSLRSEMTPNSCRTPSELQAAPIQTQPKGCGYQVFERELPDGKSSGSNVWRG